MSVEQQRAHEDGGRAQGGRRTPCLVLSWLISRRGLQVLWITFVPKNHVPEGFIPFGLRLIFLFYETLK